MPISPIEPPVNPTVAMAPVDAPDTTSTDDAAKAPAPVVTNVAPTADAIAQNQDVTIAAAPEVSSLADSASVAAPAAPASAAAPDASNSAGASASATQTGYDSMPVPVPTKSDELAKAIMDGAVTDGVVNGELTQTAADNNASDRFASDIVDGATLVFHGDIKDGVKYLGHTVVDALDVIGDLASIIGFPMPH